MSAWTIPVPLLPDELFSSWLVRAALIQGCDPLVLTGELWPKWRIWTIDPDRGLSEERLSDLEKVSGIKASAFDAACLRPIVSNVTAESPNDLAIWPWMLALGSRNRRRHGGLQYCPSCLKNDRLPYYRAQWRLAWHTGCAKHEVGLIDRCPHCNAPIEPHRLLALDDDLAICATCKGDLREVNAMSIDTKALAFQQGADRVVMYRQGGYGVNTLSSWEWFSLSRYFVMLLRKVALGKSDGLTSFVRALDVDVDTIAPPATGLALELLPAHERAMLLARAWQMLQVGPERFLGAARDARLSTQSLHEKSSSAPRCIQDIVHELADRHISRMRKKQCDIPSPRSQQAVMRMWARLQRKVEIAAR